MPSINFVRPEVRTMREQYSKIADALAGEEAVKRRGPRYLPAPLPLDTEEGRQRYYEYKTRAVFYNVTKRTQQGLQGQLFSRDPLIEVPGYLDFTVANMDGLGMNAMQQTKRTTAHVTAFGRAGLLSDFPTTGGEVTAAQLQSGEVAPSITFYQATQIINWRYERNGTKKKLLHVILEEEREVWKDNDFSFTKGKQFRVLRLDSAGEYIIELYHDDKQAAFSTAKPTDYNGNPLRDIPFQFIGSEDNDPDIDDPPMYSLASLNIAHFRNSADFEESVFIVGQPTIVMTGLSQGWVDGALKGQPVQFGSRRAIPLPVGAKLEIAQAEPNNLSNTAMERKERQMVALGAKLVEERQVQRTATEASHEEGAEASVLQTVADNTSVAYAQAFKVCGQFVNASDEGIKFKINTAFEIATMDATARQETIKEWQMGAITWSEMRQVLRRCGIATLPDEEAKTITLEEERQRAAAFDAANPEGGNSNAPGGNSGQANV